MSDALILIAKGSKSVRLEPAPYETEKEFEELIADYPELLAGDQIDPDSPRRWLLIGAQVAISDTDGGSGRWALDHLFVDQDGVATLVEIKRQSDARLRREVIGQVLEYAANAGRTWSAQFLEEAFSATCRKSDSFADPMAILSAFLEDSSLDPALFWKVVSEKLQKGDMRLLFVADRVPPELVRIIEFLNGQTSTTEILAIEVQRYSGGGFSTHVPRLLGQSTRAIDAKSAVRAGGTRRKWDEATFFQKLESDTPVPEVSEAVRKVFEALPNYGFEWQFGTGVTYGSINARLPKRNTRALLTFKSNGGMLVQFGEFRRDGDQPLQRDLANAIATSGLQLPEGYENRYYEYSPDQWVPKASELLKALEALSGAGEPAPAV